MWSASWALKWSCLPLSPVVSLNVGGGCWLVWPPSWALKWSCLLVSRCLRLSPLMWGVGAGWCGRLLGLWSGLVSRCLRLSPLMWGVGAGWCGRLLGLWSGLVSRCLRLSPLMWGVGAGWCGRLLGLWSGLVSRCLRLSPFMWEVGVGWRAASGTKTFRNQNHRFQSKFAYCKLFGVYAGVIPSSVLSFVYSIYSLFSFLQHPVETDLSGWLDNPGKLKTLIYHDHLLTKP